MCYEGGRGVFPVLQLNARLRYAQIYLRPKFKQWDIFGDTK